MPADTFWSTQNRVVPVSVLDNPTTGDAQPDVIENMPGSKGGALPAGYLTGARAVYPIYGTTGNVMPPPPTALDLANFAEWHSGHQIEDILTNGPRTITVAGELVGYYVLTQNNTVPINLINMTLSDYAMLSATDKTALGPALRNPALGGVAARLGLTNSKTDLNATLADFEEKINTESPAMTASGDKLVFLRQIELIRRAVNAADMVIPAKVLQEAKDVKTRFDRAKAFAETRQSTNLTRVDLYNPNDGGWSGSINGLQAQTNAVSSDNGATINDGYAEFMRAEEQILTMKLRREALSRDTALRDPKLDVANLIYQLQLLYEAEAEGIADSGTEEMKQLHKYLQDIGIMQRLVNDTLKAYDQSKPEEKRRFMNMGGRNDTNTSVEGEQRSHYVGNDPVRIGVVSQQGTVYPAGMSGSPARYDNSAGYPWWLLQGSGLSGTTISTIFSGTHTALTLYSRIGHDNPGKTNGGLTAEEMRVFSMFNDDSWAAGGTRRQPHPIEVFFGVGARPVQKFTSESRDGVADYSLTLYRKGEFDGFLTNLNDYVTQLNQKSQIKQNEIESASRRQNRHFELGNNALRKMNDMLMTIGRM